MFTRLRAWSRGFGVGAAAGAVTAYLFDPAQGPRRRARLRDQSIAEGRRFLRRAEQKARFFEGNLEGVLYRLTPAEHEGEPVSGAVLADKVKSEVLGKEPFSAYVIDVDVDDRVVHLRGEVDRPEVVRALRHEIEGMPDVASVENLIHPPGTPAPNKAEARRAS